MSKRKQKNPLRYWIDELIFFKRDVTYLTPASIEAVEQRLSKLSYEKSGCWRTRRIVATVDGTGNEHTFEIKAEQPGDSNYYQSAQAKGTIFRDDDDITVVHGTIQMGSWETWLGLLIPLVFIYFVMSNVNEGETAEATLFLLIFGAFMVFNWVQLYNDRNYLHQIIERTIEATRTLHAYNQKPQ